MTEVLDNGLRVLIQENHAAPVVAIQMWVDAGSADDPDRHAGLAHVVEHMVFKGTARRSEGQIASDVESAGGQINAWTSFDQTVFHVVIASRFFGNGLEILADALQSPSLDSHDLQRELAVILEEIKQGEDQPGRVVSRNLFAAAYRKHPYRRSVIGSAGSLQRIRRAPRAVKRFFQRFYVPANMTLVVVGDIRRADALRRIRKLFDGPTGAPRRAARPEEPRQRRLRVSVVERDTSEAYIYMAFHIPGLTDADTPALDLGAVILGQGESSRLTRRVKHELQAVTTAHAYSYTPRDPGLLVLGATAQPGKIAAAIRAMVREAVALGRSEVTPDELQRAKTIIDSDAVYQKETVQGQARKLGFYQTVGGGAGFEQRYNRRIADVSPTRLREVAARHLKLGNLTISVVAPSAGEGGVAGLERDVRDAATVGDAEARASEVAARSGDAHITRVRLKNGARLLVMRDSTVPLVAMRAVWNGGLRYETAANNGINALLSALVTRGTSSRSADVINETIESMGGAIGGFSGQNSFGVRAELLARHWEQGLEIVADCVLNPAFDGAEVERERRALIDDIVAQEDSLGARVSRLFNRTMYSRHAYRLDMLGTVNTVSALSRRQLVSYYRRHFPPGAMVLSVVGDVDPERVAARFRGLFGAHPRVTAPAPRARREPARTAPAEAFEHVQRNQAHMMLGYPGATLRSKDRYALEVLASVLSGQGGRLFLELRDRQGLAYQVGAFSHEGVDPGHFSVYIATSPDKIPQAVAGIERELERVRTRPVSAAELRRVKRYLVGSFEISLQRRSTVASYLAFNEVYGLGYRTYTRYADAILAVTAADVRRVARRYLDPRRRVLAVVKPPELSPGAARQLGEERRAGVATDAPPPRRRRKRRSRRAPGKKRRRK